MTLRTIVTLPDPILRRKARAVTTFDKKLQTLIDDMIETMRDAPGVGLAAPQVGVSDRLLVVEYFENEQAEEAEDETKKKVWILLNPEIVKVSEEKVMGVEGCLSVPNLVGEVERHEALTIKAFNRRGQLMRVKTQGWLARIFQHEIDHLNGVVFPDLATHVWIPETEEEKQDRV
jgi:peptide deformylase